MTLEDVQDNASAARTEPGLGFELARGVGGPALRGFVRASGEAAWRVLRDACARAMARRPLPADLPVRWAAVVGRTALDTREAAALVADDIVLIDDAQCTPDALHCQLVAGAGRHPAGRVSLQQTGLQLIAFDRKGHTAMDRTPPHPSPARAAKPDSMRSR